MSDKIQKGVDLIKAEKFTEALAYFSSLIEKEPNQADYYCERGVTYFYLKDKLKALKDFDRAVELQPNKPYRYSSRAYILGYFGHTEEAIEDYKKAVELDPEDAIAYNNLGLLEEKLGYKTSAVENFKKADLLKDGKQVDGTYDIGVEGKELNYNEEEKETTVNSIWEAMGQLKTKEGRASFYKFLKSGFKEI